MRRRSSRVVALVLLLNVASRCSDKPPAIGIDVPESLTASLVTFDTVLLRWRPPAGASALELEGRVEEGDWQPLGFGSGRALFVTIGFTPDAPEATTYGFRIRALRSGATSAWSEVATVRRGVRPATDLEVLAGALDAPLELSWTRGSTQADALRLERRLVELDGVTAGPWSTLAPPALDATSYTDADVATWVDGASLEYRLVYSIAGEDSDPAEGRSMQAPPLAPVALVATADGVTSIRLDWTARSRYATKQVVIREPRWAPGAAEVATLPSDAATYVDTVPSAGTYVYRISARVGDDDASNFVADGAPALGFTARPDLPFAISTVPLPPRAQAARDAQGRFATVEVVASPSHAVRTSRQTASGLDVHETTADGVLALAVRGLLFGRADRLHVLWGIVNDPTLHHEWLDGTWSADAVALALPRDAAVDGAGALHVIACAGFADYATDASGAWVVTRLPASQLAEGCALALGPLGDVRVVYSSPRPVPPGGGSPTASDLYVLTGDGSAWTEELVAVGAEGTTPGGDVLRVFAPSADRTVLVYEAPTPGVSDVRVRSIAREGAGWGAPVEVGVRVFDGMPESFDAAMAPDGSRVAVAWNGTAAGSSATLALRDAAGSWSSAALHPTGQGVAIGFSPAGKLWVLDALGGPMDGLLYEEP